MKSSDKKRKNSAEELRRNVIACSTRSPRLCRLSWCSFPKPESTEAMGAGVDTRDDG